MKKLKHTLAVILIMVLSIGFTAGIRQEARASVVKSGTYQGKSITLKITDTTSSSRRSDFMPVTFYNGKEYKKPAYQYIHIADQYGTYFEFEYEPCCRKGKKSMIAWSGGTGAGGGQTCWAVIAKKSAKKITLKVYWQDNMSAAMGESQPECILKETLKLADK